MIELDSSRYQIFVISLIRISAEFPAYNVATLAGDHMTHLEDQLMRTLSHWEALETLAHLVGGLMIWTCLFSNGTLGCCKAPKMPIHWAPDPHGLMNCQGYNTAGTLCSCKAHKMPALWVCNIQGLMKCHNRSLWKAQPSVKCHNIIQKSDSRPYYLTLRATMNKNMASNWTFWYALRNSDVITPTLLYAPSIPSDDKRPRITQEEHAWTV